MARVYMGLMFISGLMCGHLLSFLYHKTALSDPDKKQVQCHPQGHADLVSLEQHNKPNTPVTPMNITDVHKTSDNRKVAEDLFENVRVLCWVMTYKNNHRSRAIHVKNTWGKRCNKLIFISDVTDQDLPAVPVVTKAGKSHLTAKTMSAFDYVSEHYLDNYDWFLKADDDTYVVLENLRYLLSSQKTSEPVYFGHAFRVIVEQGYFSGGGGYVLSREALRRFKHRKSEECAKDYGDEDVEIGRCMQRLGVKAGDSRDALGRSRFHCFNLETHIHGAYPHWFYKSDKYGGKKGINSISDYPITFHYITVQQMYNMEFYIYHFRPYGIIPGIGHFNGPPQKEGFG